MLVDTNLSMAGYSVDKMPAMQKRMIEAMEAIPGVTQVGLVDVPPLHMGWAVSPVFTDKMTDLRPWNAVAQAVTYKISPEYFDAARHRLVGGQDFLPA